VGGLSGATVEIDRLNIALHGVSADIAEAAVAGLGPALRRRLGSLRTGRSFAVPALRIDAIDLPPGIDAAALRELIADRLVEAIDNRTAPQQVEEDA
jgi:hypothetical protein